MKYLSVSGGGETDDTGIARTVAHTIEKSWYTNFFLDI